jgi:hypothetical protein
MNLCSVYHNRELIKKVETDYDVLKLIIFIFTFFLFVTTQYIQLLNHASRTRKTTKIFHDNWHMCERGEKRDEIRVHLYLET